MLSSRLAQHQHHTPTIAPHRPRGVDRDGPSRTEIDQTEHPALSGARYVTTRRNAFELVVGTTSSTEGKGAGEPAVTCWRLFGRLVYRLGRS